MDPNAPISPQDPLAPTVIALGGTGMIGRALRRVATGRGLSFLSLSLDPDHRGAGNANLQLDFRTAPEGAIAAALTQALPVGSPLQSLCIIAGLSPRQITEVAGFAANRGVPVAQVSSCLLYRAKAGATVDESCPSLTEDEANFPYLRLKLAEEAALKASRCNWRLLRTNHILGPGGLLGCIPDHNRDALLLQHLHAGPPLRLVHAGRVRVSIVHAEDLAAAMLDLCEDGSSAGHTLNVVHPDPVMADDYFRQLAALMGLPAPAIIGLQPDPKEFWSLTARDIAYASSHPAVARLRFRHDLISALKDSLAVGERAYADLGGHLRGRLDGNPRG